MLCALSVIIMLIGSIFLTLDLSAAAAAGLTVVFAMIELGRKYAFLVYAASSLLALLLLPNKAPAVVFALFAGIYPILKAYLHRIRIKVLSFMAKILVFNLFFSGIIFLGRELLGVREVLGVPEAGYMQAVFYALGNLTFVLYDIALDRLVLYYGRKIKRIFDKNFRIR